MFRRILQVLQSTYAQTEFYETNLKRRTVDCDPEIVVAGLTMCYIRVKNSAVVYICEPCDLEPDLLCLTVNIVGTKASGTQYRS